jgi:hypothetical protein
VKRTSLHRAGQPHAADAAAAGREDQLHAVHLTRVEDPPPRGPPVGAPNAALWRCRRDLLAAKVGYREALVSVGGVPPLLELLEQPEKAATLFAAQALASAASSTSCRPAIRRGLPAQGPAFKT